MASCVPSQTTTPRTSWTYSGSVYTDLVCQSSTSPGGVLLHKQYNQLPLEYNKKKQGGTLSLTVTVTMEDSMVSGSKDPAETNSPHHATFGGNKNQEKICQFPEYSTAHFSSRLLTKTTNILCTNTVDVSLLIRSGDLTGATFACLKLQPGSHHHLI
jgi:hypothetical protein